MTPDEETSKFDPNAVLRDTQRFEESGDRDPIELAVHREWLADEAASQLLVDCNGDSSAALRKALEQALISAGEYDIVTALSGLRPVAPGYHITGLLGQGGMGAVYRAVQETLDRPVALKTIHINTESQSEAVTRFEQEARTVAKLRHPNVITAYDYGNHAGRLYLALELVDGKDLDTHLAQGPIDEELTWHVARQVAAALAAASNAGIVHRDIKPANILLVAPPEGTPLPDGVPMVKVADFGLSFLQNPQSSDRVTSANVAVGSPHYMAPELLSGEDASAASDMYALGATVYRCIVGKPPFAGKALPAVISDKVSGVPPDADHATPASHALIAAMMAPDPKDRPASFNELIDQIDRLIGTCPSKAAGGVQRTVLTSDSSRAMWAKVVGMIVAVIVTATVVTMVAPPPRPPANTDAEAAKQNAAESDAESETAIAKYEVGHDISLFNGYSADGWITDSTTSTNVWSVARNTENIQTLSGSAGVAYKSLEPILREQEKKGQSIRHYRIRAVAERQVGDRVGFRFNRQKDGSLYELIVSDERASIVSRDSNGELTETLHEGAVVAVATESNVSVKSEISIDLCESEWSIDVNGTELGSIPIIGSVRPEVGLSIIDGPVLFSDLKFIELRSADDAGEAESLESPEDAT